MSNIPKRPAKQLLHVVFGGEFDSVSNIKLKNLNKLDIVGSVPSYASAYTHRLLEPESRAPQR